MDSSSVTVPPGEPGGDIVTDITADLDMSHDWVGSMVVKLAGPSGLMTLMSRPGMLELADDGGGCCGASVDLIEGNVQAFDNSASLSAEDIWITAVGGDIPEQSIHPDGGVLGLMSLMEMFAGTRAVGEWTFYSANGQSDFGRVNSWTLNVTTVPEPTTPALLGVGALPMIRRR